MRRTFSKSLLGAALVFLGMVMIGEAAPPNIVLIMADDMGFADVGCYGGEIETPNIDRLAAEGLLFRQFYNNAKCTTTRASLLTGLYPRRDGQLLKPNMVTIAEVLKQAGYKTALGGKWHLGNAEPRRPSDRGFDEYYGLLDGCCNYFDPSIPDPEFKGGKTRFFAKNDVRITEFKGGFYTTDAFTDYAMDFVERATQGENPPPFFLHLCYTAPHYPLHAKPEDIKKYQGKYLEGWEKLREERHKRQIELGLVDPDWPLPGPNREMQTWEAAENKDWQDLRMATYAAMIDSMDQNIGSLLAKLDEKGLAENTVVMFLADNGGCPETPGGNDPKNLPGPREFYSHVGPDWAAAQNTPFRRYKSTVHEGGISTPLIVRWPGKIKPDTMTDQVGHVIDLLPTCAALGGASYPEKYNGQDILPVEGLSLLPIFEGQTREPHKTLYWEWSGNRAIRQRQWKLVWDKGIKKWELYNVETDRTETNDLAKFNLPRVKAMTEAWNAWAERTGVKNQEREKESAAQ
jgi:arylsulfatase